MNALSPDSPLLPSRLLSHRPRPDAALTVALVNNMPDAAVHATERQFSALLGAASGPLTVRLKIVSPPGLSRAPSLRRHIETCYDPFGELERDPPDAMIVTGTEPRAAALRDEPLWPVLSGLVDLAERARIPTIWSCMAAHAAALRLGGPHRVKLPAKLSGLFSCRARLRPSPFLRGLQGTSYIVPHSRVSGLPAEGLREAGFDILAQGRETGPDIAVFEGQAWHILLQGHPEYGAAALLGEYRRDMARFLFGERDTLPAPPEGYFGRARRAALAEFEARAQKKRDPALLPAFDVLAADLATHHDWSPVATLLYRNWLHEAIRRRRAPHSSRLLWPTRWAARAGGPAAGQAATPCPASLVGAEKLASRTGLEPVLPT